MSAAWRFPFPYQERKANLRFFFDYSQLWDLVFSSLILNWLPSPGFKEWLSMHWHQLLLSWYLPTWVPSFEGRPPKDLCWQSGLDNVMDWWLRCFWVLWLWLQCKNSYPLTSIVHQSNVIGIILAHIVSQVLVHDRRTFRSSTSRWSFDWNGCTSSRDCTMCCYYHIHLYEPHSSSDWISLIVHSTWWFQGILHHRQYPRNHDTWSQ